MILVKIDTMRNRGGEVLQSKSILADTVGQAINEIAPSPAEGATFVVEIIAKNITVALESHNR